MLINIRPAQHADAGALVRLYDLVYRGGYSACFGKYGPIGPEDFWWVQSEKEVLLLEVNREPAGLLVIGREKNRLLVEEAIAVTDDPGAAPRPLLERVHGAMRDRFKTARQDRVRLRTMERNPLGTGIARTFAYTFVDALIVSALRPVTKTKIAPPEGYAIRRAVARQDEAAIARLDRECLGGRVRPEDLAGTLAHARVRAFVALWGTQPYPAGFVIATAKGPATEWRIGVRDEHRGKGVGAALARAATGAMAGWGVETMVATHWTGDAVAERFGSALGFATERVYLYCEHPL